MRIVGSGQPCPWPGCLPSKPWPATTFRSSHRSIVTVFSLLRVRLHRTRRGRPSAGTTRHRQELHRNGAGGQSGASRHGDLLYPLANLIAQLAKAEREGTLGETIRFLTRVSLLVVDEIGYLPVTPGGANLFFQLVNSRYEKGAMILTSNRGFAEWGEVFGDPVVATALLDRLLHHAIVIQIEGSSYRLRQHADLVPENARARPNINPPAQAKRRGRPPGPAGPPGRPGPPRPGRAPGSPRPGLPRN